ncbi:hypothetical protein [Allohahella sp. A8]|uniref:hypothetical protein n=1 Tax=Allohahella sp. A8 TaxID=3141461 RepID=UPI003A7F8C2B
MNKDEFREAGQKLFGYGWQTRIAERIDVDGSTVRRWASGAVPVPGAVAAWLKCELSKVKK